MIDNTAESRPGSASRRVHVLPLCAFLLVAACFFYDVLFGDKTFIARDHYLFFLPRRYFALEALRSGILPLWNPYNACGVPYMANLQSSVFYPLSLIVYLLPFPLGYNVFIVAHYVLGAYFMYLLMLGWQAGRQAAVVSGVVFAFGGYMLSINDNVAFLTSGIWLPLIMWCFCRALDAESLKTALVAALPVALQVFAGDASFCVLASIVCTGLYVFIPCAAQPRRGLKSRAGRFCLVWSIGLLLASVQLLPFFEFVALSHRAGGMGQDEALRWSLHPLELLQLIHPFVFGRLVPNLRWFGQQWLDTLYIGIFPLFFGVLCVASRRGSSRHKVFLVAVFLLGVFLALGKYNPLIAFIFERMPGLRLMQYPVKFLLLSAFSSAALAGKGFDCCMRFTAHREPVQGLLKPMLLPFCLLISVLLAMALFRQELFEQFMRVYPPAPYLAKVRDMHFFGLYRGLYIAAGLAGALALVLRAVVRYKRHPGPLFLMVLAIIAADLFFVGAPHDPVIRRSEVRQLSGTVRALQQDRGLYRIYSLSRIAGKMSYLHVSEMPFSRTYHVLSNSLPPNMHIYQKMYSIDEYAALLNSRYYAVAGRAIRHFAGTSQDAGDVQFCRNMFSLLNVKYIISPFVLDGFDFKLLKKGPIKIYENTRVLPRAFVADAVVPCRDDTTVLQNLHSAVSGPATAYVPEAELRKLSRALRDAVSAPPPAPADAALPAVTSRINSVSVDLTMSAPGLLVLSDNWYPGWQVHVNGIREPLLRVNHTLRGVALRPGAARVVFSYRPLSLLLGAAVTAAVIAVWCCWMLLLLKRERNAGA